MKRLEVYCRKRAGSQHFGNKILKIRFAELIAGTKSCVTKTNEFRVRESFQ